MNPIRINAVTLIGCLLLGTLAGAQEPDWSRVGDETAELLAEYIRIDTRNPPGRTVEAAAFLADRLRAAGTEIERVGAVPDKPILIARLRGSREGEKPIILLNHMDVVPAEADEWSFPPLAGDVQDGFVRGRGAVDMKGFAVVQLVALRLLAERRRDLRHDLVFLAVPDEEVGGTLGTAWLEQNRPDLMSAAGVWDEGGFGLTDAFPKPVLLISVTEKKVLWLRLIAEGPAGHGSRPFPEAAPVRLHRALERVLTNPPAPRLTPVARETFRRIGRVVGGFEGLALRRLKNPLVWLFADGILQRDPLSYAMVRDTIALTMLNAGYKPNVIPGRAEAVLDCRLLPDTKQDDFLERLRDTIEDPGVRIEVLQPAHDAPVSPTDHPLYRAMEEAGRVVYPKAFSAPFMTVGGTDSRFFRRQSVPAYGLIPMLLPEEIAASSHGVDERLPVDVLGSAVRFVYEALLRL